MVKSDFLDEAEAFSAFFVVLENREESPSVYSGEDVNG
jgi:hypothetical protein